MNIYLRSLLSCFLLVSSLFRTYAQAESFACAGSIVVLADSTTAAIISLKPDAYTREQTSFDLAIRFDKAKGITTKDYLQAAAANVRSWPEREIGQLEAAFASIDSIAKATGMHFHMPDTVILIKTTAKEEFGAEGYTRENRIMLNTAREPISLHLIAHELWHVISRHNPSLRNSAYGVFHFKPCNNVVYKPAMKNRVITNPDCPYLMHYISVEKAGKMQDVTLVLYSKNEYQPGKTMEHYINIGLMALTGDDKHKKPLMKENKPVIYEIMEVPDLFKQIGMNTQYILHIEEIAAEHFAALVAGEKLKQMEYVEGFRMALMQ